MKKNKTFLNLDMDGVLADIVTPFLIKANVKFGTDVKYEDITEHKIETFFGIENTTEVLSYLLELLKTGEYWREVPPVIGAVEAVRELKEHFDLVILTAGQLGSAPFRALWAKEVFGLSENQIIITPQKHRVHGILVDDFDENVLNRPSSILFKQPWNINSRNKNVSFD